MTFAFAQAFKITMYTIYAAYKIIQNRNKIAYRLVYKQSCCSSNKCSRFLTEYSSTTVHHRLYAMANCMSIIVDITGDHDNWFHPLFLHNINYVRTPSQTHTSHSCGHMRVLSLIIWLTDCFNTCFSDNKIICARIIHIQNCQLKYPIKTVKHGKIYCRRHIK